MMSALKKLEQLTTGLTQQDQTFRDALEELSGETINFYDNKQRAYTRLNHALVGREADIMQPVNVVGSVDFNQKRLTTLIDDEEITYQFDEIDPEYIETMKQMATTKGLNPEKMALPLTDLAMDLLDDLHADKELKPEINTQKRDRNLASRRNLQRAFENEMLFNVNLQKYLSDTGLDAHFDAHSDDLTEFIGEKRFQASFNDGLKRIDDEMNSRVDAKGLGL